MDLVVYLNDKGGSNNPEDFVDPMHGWSLPYLREDPGVVGGAGSVPEEHPIVQRAELPEPLGLAAPRDLEDLLDPQLVEVVGGGVRVLHVLLQRPELVGLALQDLEA